MQHFQLKILKIFWGGPPPSTPLVAYGALTPSILKPWVRHCARAVRRPASARVVG